MKAICVGHSTYDITLPVEKFPVENKKTRLQESIENGGGPAANAGYLLALWNVDTTILSAIGDDYYGKLIIDELKKVKVHTQYIDKVKNHKTSSSYIIANLKKGTRTILTVKDKPIRKLSYNKNLKADIILVDGEHPETAMKVLKDNKEAVSILDAGRLNEDTLVLGKLVTYVICSKDFAEEFSKIKIDYANKETIISCYEKLKEYYNTNIIITLEEKGSFTEIDGMYCHLPSVKEKSLDSTGAGDIFHGAFAYFIANSYSLKDAIHYASIAGALSVKTIGSRYSIPRLEEVENYDDII